MSSSVVLLMQPLGMLSQPSGYMRTCFLEPIAIECLAGAAEHAGFASVILPGTLSERELAEAIEHYRPLAIGLSVHTYVYNEALALARAAKEKGRELGLDVAVIFGGYHPSALPEDVAKEPAVDYVVVGEGEETLCELLSTLASGGDPSQVAGLVFRRGSELVATGRRARISNLDALPFPKRAPELLRSARQYQIAYPAPDNQVGVAQVMYSRGCPFSCAFCSSENTWGRHVYWRSPKVVLDEIETLVEQFGTNLVYFPDLTLNVDRGRVLDLCSEFIKRRPPVSWWGLFRVDLLDDEILSALADAGCVKISLGIESLNRRVTDGVKGHYDSSSDQLMRNLMLADEKGLIVKAFLMIGFPEETGEEIAAYSDGLLALPVDELRVTYTTPFPGTRFWHTASGEGLLPADTPWSAFTTEVPVLAHPRLSRDELQTLRHGLVRAFYLDQRYVAHALSKTSRYPHLRPSWIQYFRFLVSKGVFTGDEPALRDLLGGLA